MSSSLRGDGNEDRSSPISSVEDLLKFNTQRDVALVLIIWAFFLVRGFFFAGVIPIWEGYDEWAHFSYAQNLQVSGTLPIGTTTRISREIEASFALLPLPWEMRNLSAPHDTHDTYWRLTAEDRDDRSRRLRSIPREYQREPAQADVLLYEAQQPPLYYWLLQGPLYLMRNSPLPERVYLLRYFSLLLASIVIPIGYAVAKRAFHNPAIAIAIIAVIALMPEFVMEFSRVANDSLAAALFSILLLLAIGILNEPLRTGRIIAYGFTLSLGLLTKTYFLTAIPPTALLFTWLYLRRRQIRGRILGYSCVAAVMPLALSGWWYFRNHAATGSWSGLQQDVDLHEMSLMALLRLIPDVDWRVAFDGFFVSHIYFGNWSFLQLRYWFYHFFFYLALFAAAGFVVFIWRFFTGNRNRVSLGVDPKSILILACFYGCFVLGLAYHVLITYASGGGSSTCGWYIYCLVIAELSIVTAGMMAILPVRLHPWILPSLAVCFALLDLYATHLVLIPYYTGLIAHNPNGALATFHIEQYSADGISLAIHRLVNNKPVFLNETVLVAAWSLFLVSTVVLVVISVRFRATARTDSDSQWVSRKN